LKLKIILGALSGALLIGGLYMLETIEWHRSWGFTQYVLPFGFQCEWWIARDLAYSLIILGYLFILSINIHRRGKRKI